MNMEFLILFFCAIAVKSVKLSSYFVFALRAFPVEPLMNAQFT